MKLINRFSSTTLLVLISLTLSLFEGGCNALRPSRPVPAEENAPIFIAPTLIPQASPTPTVDVANPNDSQPENCFNQLTYLKDLTIPDGAVVTAGSTIEKKWQVKNSGTCNWNEKYTIKLIGGPDLGAANPQAIVPARGGTEAIIQITFTAPVEPGNYTSSWQAFDPEDQAFGDPFTIEINVSAP